MFFETAKTLRDFGKAILFGKAIIPRQQLFNYRSTHRQPVHSFFTFTFAEQVTVTLGLTGSYLCSTRF